MFVVADEGFFHYPDGTFELVDGETFQRHGDGSSGEVVGFDPAGRYYPRLTGMLNGLPPIGFGGLHSAWNGYTLWEDLLAVQSLQTDPALQDFHDRNSFLFVDKNHRVPLYVDGLGPPFWGVTEIGVDPPPHEYPYRGDLVTSYVTGSEYAGHATGTFDPRDYGNSNEYVGISQRRILAWLEELSLESSEFSPASVTPLGCGYNLPGGFFVLGGEPQLGQEMTVGIRNPVSLSTPSFPGALDPNQRPAQLQYVQEMDWSVQYPGDPGAYVAAVWSGARYQLPCGLLQPGGAMQFYIGEDSAGNAIFDATGALVEGIGEVIVEMPFMSWETSINNSNFTPIAGQGETSEYTFSIPSSTPLGVSLYLQAMVIELDPPLGDGPWMALTDALELRVGP